MNFRGFRTKIIEKIDKTYGHQKPQNTSSNNCPTPHTPNNQNTPAKLAKKVMHWVQLGEEKVPVLFSLDAPVTVFG